MIQVFFEDFDVDGRPSIGYTTFVANKPPTEKDLMEFGNQLCKEGFVIKGKQIFIPGSRILKVQII